MKVLESTFGYNGFRAGQEEIITAILQGEDVLAVMPTGAGKSICFQIPALIMDGICLVISPLIALMQDQVSVLKQKGIQSEYLASGMDDGEVRDIYSRLSKGMVKILYVAPERLKSEWFRNFISELDISFIAIDEAHCISEWGHDFRPSYRLISEHLQVGKNGTYRIAAFTATATDNVRNDICEVMRLNNPRVFIRGFDRPNLTYNTEICDDKKKRILELVKDKRGEDSGSAIVYAGSRKRVEEIYHYLKDNGVSTQIYHAGLADKLRERNQNQFIGGEVNVIVATNAFGMGVDKPDIRVVVHHDMPSTMESYYQEAGRAGRDGLKSECILLYKRGDERLPEFFIKCTYPEKSAISKIWRIAKAAITSGEPEIITNAQHQIAAKADVPFATVSNVISLFERHDYLVKSRIPTSAQIKFEVPIEDLRDLDRNLSDNTQKSCLRAVVKFLPSTAMKDYCELDILKLSNISGIDRALIRGFIGYLSNGGYASVRYSGAIGTFQLNPELEEVDFPPIDYEKMEVQKERSQSMLDNMLDYVKQPGCNKNFILNYFGEDPGTPCGRCSGCKGEGLESKSDKKNKESVINAVAATGERYGRVMLVSFLKGEANERLQQAGLTGMKEFASFKNSTSRDIHLLIDELIAENKLQVSEGQYKTISLGKNAYESYITKSLDSIGNLREQRKNIITSRESKIANYEELLSQLVEAISKIEGIKKSQVASKALIKKIAEFNPSGTHHLEEIGALGNKWIGKYKYLVINISELIGRGQFGSEGIRMEYFAMLNQISSILVEQPDISLRLLRSEHELFYPYSTIKAGLRDLKESQQQQKVYKR